MYLYLLLSNLESYLIQKRKYVEKLLNEDNLKIKDGMKILKSFENTLIKTNQILDTLNSLDEKADEDLFKSVIILISESLAWILFTLPSLPEKLPFFKEEFLINNENVLDIIGNNLINLESFLNEPSEILFIKNSIKGNVSSILNVITYLYKGLEKSLVLN